MKFKIKKIKNKEKKNWPKFAKIFFLAAAIFGAVIFAATKIWRTKILQKKAAEILFPELRQNPDGKINLLLLGVAGKNEEGGHLSDTILVVSVDPKNSTASFLSLPRDLFISSKIGDRKINEIYAAGRYKNRKNSDGGNLAGLQIIKDAVGNFIGKKIQYGAVINFKVFEEIIDEMGGIKIYVEEDIEDPFFPDDNYGYQTFVVRKGQRIFDGATALKYARSRKTSSDYDRARRQQDLLFAIRKKALEINLLTDPKKIKNFFSIFKKNINTDIKISEMLAFAKIFVKMNYENSIFAVLNDDETKKGGFLFAPAKDFFGGQFVLLPTDLKTAQQFFWLVLERPQILLENAQISVLNGSKMSGRAAEIAADLRRLGLHVIEIDNFDSPRPVVETFLENITGKKNETFEFLQKYFEINPQKNSEKEKIFQPKNLIDIKIIIGIN